MCGCASVMHDALVANWAFTLEILRTLAQNELDFAFATKITLNVPAC